MVSLSNHSGFNIESGDLKGYPYSLLYVLIGILLCMVHCAMQPMAGDTGGSPQDPPFPRTESILPLVQGNCWNYSYTAYDSTGKLIDPHRLDLGYMVTAQYGIPDDTTLVRITMSNYATKFNAYAYQYTVEEQDSGYLLTYRQLYPLGKRGVYIIGYYDHGSCHLYPDEQLWLAYPADSGFSWQFSIDSAETTSMAILSTNARCEIIDSTIMAGIRVIDSCYLYQETAGEYSSYYYYHPKYGALAYQQYYRDRLMRTYVLKSFTNEFERTVR
jgi:hypothetical protein